MISDKFNITKSIHFQLRFENDLYFASFGDEKTFKVKQVRINAEKLIQINNRCLLWELMVRYSGQYLLKYHNSVLT